MKLILKITLIYYFLICVSCNSVKSLPALAGSNPGPIVSETEETPTYTTEVATQTTDIPTPTVEPTITPTSLPEPTIPPTSTIESPPEELVSDDEPIEPQYELRRVLDNGHIEYHYRFQDNDSETDNNTMTKKDIKRLFTIPSSCDQYINLENNIISIEIPGDGNFNSENIKCGIYFNFDNMEFESKDQEAIQVARIQYSLLYRENIDGDEIKYNYYINLNKYSKYEYHESQFQFVFNCLDKLDHTKTIPVQYSNGLYTFFKTESTKPPYDLYPDEAKTMRPYEDSDSSFLSYSNGTHEKNFLLNYEMVTSIPGTVTLYLLEEEKSPVISDNNILITYYRTYKDKKNEISGIGGLNCLKPWPYSFGIQTVGGAGLGVKIHDIYIETIPSSTQVNND